mmetsp:Transcript_139665/g.260454  ORF Transcript_139665/g.260454 Transcript_139665/m.260454 type:complete len:265 (-) Transcript_139665:58-852(-)
MSAPDGDFGASAELRSSSCSPLRAGDTPDAYRNFHFPLIKGDSAGEAVGLCPSSLSKISAITALSGLLPPRPSAIVDLSSSFAGLSSDSAFSSGSGSAKGSGSDEALTSISFGGSSAASSTAALALVSSGGSSAVSSTVASTSISFGGSSAESSPFSSCMEKSPKRIGLLGLLTSRFGATPLLLKCDLEVLLLRLCAAGPSPAPGTCHPSAGLNARKSAESFCRPASSSACLVDRGCVNLASTFKTGAASSAVLVNCALYAWPV